MTVQHAKTVDTLTAPTAQHRNVPTLAVLMAPLKRMPAIIVMVEDIPRTIIVKNVAMTGTMTLVISVINARVPEKSIMNVATATAMVKFQSLALNVLVGISTVKNLAKKMGALPVPILIMVEVTWTALIVIKNNISTQKHASRRVFIFLILF